MTVGAIAAIGSLLLGPTGGFPTGAVTFTTDPAIYRPRWAKSTSFIRGIQGTATIQDYGHRAKYKTLELQSPDQEHGIDHATKQQLDAWFRVRGATYTFEDWFGTRAVVQIADFDPVQADPWMLWEYTMLLRVTSLVKLDGVTYAGL